MSRENLRPWCRWMPLWMLKAVFFLTIIFVLLPFSIWDSIRDMIRELGRDYRDMVDAADDRRTPEPGKDGNNG